MSSLEKSFRHQTLYKGSKLTWKDFLELCADNFDCWMALVAEYKTDNLFEIPTYHHEIRFDDCKTKIKLDDEQADYFNERRRFYKKISTDKKYLIIRANIPELAEALSKVKC